MSIIDNVRKHAESKERRSIEVPEWETVLYVRDITLSDKDKIFKHAKRSQSDFATFVYAIIFQCQKEDGSPAFSLEDARVLKDQADAKVINRIGEFVFGMDDEKN